MRKGIVQDGLVAGGLGATSVAVWFLLVDLVLRHPFQTPITLGRSVFGLLGQVTRGDDLLLLIGYTVIHFIAFAVAGLLVATIVHWAEKQPAILAGGFILFVAFEVGFYSMSLMFSELSALGTLAWYNVAIGNLVAALSMGLYMWRTHPKLKTELDDALAGNE